jgi:hypothetical protein
MMFGHALMLANRASAGQNYLRYSEQFDNAVWTYTGLNATPVSANATAAPDGTVTADRIVENAAAGLHNVSLLGNLNAVLTAGNTYNLSVHAKADTRTWLIVGALSGGVHAYFNLGTGAIGTQVGSPAAAIAASSNGFYRCSINFTYALGHGVLFYLASGDGGSSYTGTNSGLYLWGAQIVDGTTMQPYVKTEATNRP